MCWGLVKDHDHGCSYEVNRCFFAGALADPTRDPTKRPRGACPGRLGMSCTQERWACSILKGGGRVPYPGKVGLSHTQGRWARDSPKGGLNSSPFGSMLGTHFLSGSLWVPFGFILAHLDLF